MNRLDNFNKLENHPFYNKYFNKLNNIEKKIAMEFIKQNDLLNNDEYATKAVRLFLDLKNKPKNWVIIEELLIASLIESK